MLLVDTSVWIEVFRPRPRLRFGDFASLDDVVTCLPVIQEVLQGFRDDLAFRRAREAMLAFPCVEAPMSVSLVEEAVSLFRSARRLGFTVRSSVDCLIAAAAVRHGLTVLHTDRDFGALAEVCPLQERRI